MVFLMPKVRLLLRRRRVANGAALIALTMLPQNGMLNICIYDNGQCHDALPAGHEVALHSLP